MNEQQKQALYEAIKNSGDNRSLTPPADADDLPRRVTVAIDQFYQTSIEHAESPEDVRSDLDYMINQLQEARRAIEHI